ncbi:MAG: hypothetical protein K9L79_01605 [Methylobacter tundripaludum]|nr:hypothetical protein [Methylobacter tundripaludum]
MSEPLPDVKRVKVKLKKPHTHAGINYDEAAVKAGIDIEITEQQAKSLKELGVI